MEKICQCRFVHYLFSLLTATKYYAVHARFNLLEKEYQLCLFYSL